MNRLIKADEVQIGHLYPLAGNETAPPETVKPTGQIANRADFKRVLAWAQATGRVVTEAEWSAGNQGCFSSGDLSTTFRFPLAKDFIRAKESDRTVGSYQADEIKSHAHALYAGADQNTYNSSRIASTGGGGTVGRDTYATGGTETRPKNIAQQYFMKI